MKKAIIAVSFSGIFINNTPWKNAHFLWFEKFSKIFSDKSIKELAYEKNYFIYVDSIMKKMYPALSHEDRRYEARKIFFNLVEHEISNSSSKANNDAINFFEKLKEKHKIVLISTTPKEFLIKILKIFRIETLFDDVFTNNIYEEDDKSLVLKRFVKKYGAPKFFISANPNDKGFKYCNDHNIECIFINLDNNPIVINNDIKIVNHYKELKQVIK